VAKCYTAESLRIIYLKLPSITPVPEYVVAVGIKRTCMIAKNVK